MSNNKNMLQYYLKEMEESKRRMSEQRTGPPSLHAAHADLVVAVVRGRTVLRRYRF